MDTEENWAGKETLSGNASSENFFSLEILPALQMQANANGLKSWGLRDF